MSDTPRTDAATKPHFESEGVTVWDYEELRQEMLTVERALSAARGGLQAIVNAGSIGQAKRIAMQALGDKEQGNEPST